MFHHKKLMSLNGPSCFHHLASKQILTHPSENHVSRHRVRCHCHGLVIRVRHQDPASASWVRIPHQWSACVCGFPDSHSPRLSMSASDVLVRPRRILSPAFAPAPDSGIRVAHSRRNRTPTSNRTSRRKVFRRGCIRWDPTLCRLSARTMTHNL
jgi:hypothetical protein